MKVRKIEHE
jgi:hypothetical protein